MAIKVSNTSVITDARQLANIASLDSATIATINANISSGATVSASAPTATNGAFWIDTNSNVLKTYNQGAWNSVAFVGSGNSFSSAITFYNATSSSIARTWVVPAGVKVVSVVAVGAGGYGDGYYGSSGGGGLAYLSAVTVTAGSSFTVTPGHQRTNLAGASSTFTGTDANGTSISLSANGGAASVNNKAIPAGGTFSGGNGGGNGGTGGGVSGSFNEGAYRYSTPGSGGAGGYSGTGGNGGAIPANGVPAAGSAGSGGAGGGGGGGTDTRYNYGGVLSGNGGGANLYGSGTSGSGGASGNIAGANGAPGSYNSDATLAASGTHGFAVDFGKGRAGRPNGAVSLYGGIRIVWQRNGSNSFPSTDVGFKSEDASIGSVLETQVSLT